MDIGISEMTLEKAKRIDILVLLFISLSWITYSILEDTFGYLLIIVPASVSVAGVALLLYLRKYVGPF